MPGRSHTSGTGYRYGFNGQEKVDEINGAGNHNTALFWEYDTRISRRWNLDPKPFIGLSDYTAFADNPIHNYDLLGDIFYVANNSKSKEDIKSLVKTKNENYLKFGEKGKVSLDFGEMNPEDQAKLLKKDEGLKLISDLENSIKNFYYANAEVETYCNQNDVNGIFFTGLDNNGIINASVYGKDSEEKHSYLPKSGYDGQVVISGQGKFEEPGPDGNMITKTRSSLVFHELAENYERTHNGVDYNGNKTNGGLGAHKRANRREDKWWGRSNSPGGANYSSNPDNGKSFKELYLQYHSEIEELQK